MKIAIVQANLEWENPTVNWANFESKIDQIKEEVDLVVLPEMFTTGFSMHPENIAETMQDKSIQSLIAKAKNKKIAITGSLIIKENNQFYNRLVFIFPDGKLEYYDKKHLFSLAGEDKVYTAGNKRIIIDYKGFKICPLICYDLRFPVFSRNTEEFDVLLYVANWPKPRITAWDTLLKARAIENMCYTIGVNRIGTDKNNLEYSGHSQVNDYLGETIINAKSEEATFIIQLDKEQMLETRTRLPFLKDRDVFKI